MAVEISPVWVSVIGAVFTAGGLVTALRIFMAESEKHSTSIDNLKADLASFRVEIADRLGNIEGRLVAKQR